MTYVHHPDYTTALPPSLDLNGRYAIVTGASRGIGRQIALTLASRGVHVAVTYTSDSSTTSANELVEHCVSLGRRAVAIKYDLAQPDCGGTIVSAALKGLETTHIDFLVNNAAIGQPGGPRPVAEPVSAEDFDKVFHTNVRAPMLLMQAVLPHFNPAGGNRIVNISSISGRMTPMQFQLYSTSKAALDNLTRVWAKELAAAHKCTVNGILVGATLTPDAPASAARSAALNLITAEKRYGEMDDVADIVAFVVSGAARWINGDRIGANGGMVIEA